MFFDDGSELADPDTGHSMVGIEFEVVEFVVGIFGLRSCVINEEKGLIADVVFHAGSNLN